MGDDSHSCHASWTMAGKSAAVGFMRVRGSPFVSVSKKSMRIVWGTVRCLSMESFFVTPLYRMNGNSSHESSLYQGPYPGAVSGQDAPPGPIQPAQLGVTQQGGSSWVS